MSKPRRWLETKGFHAGRNEGTQRGVRAFSDSCDSEILCEALPRAQVEPHTVRLGLQRLADGDVMGDALVVAATIGHPLPRPSRLASISTRRRCCLCSISSNSFEKMGQHISPLAAAGRYPHVSPECGIERRDDGIIRKRFRNWIFL